MIYSNLLIFIVCYCLLLRCILCIADLGNDLITILLRKVSLKSQGQKEYHAHTDSDPSDYGSDNL
jgi:hypothetical protein